MYVPPPAHASRLCVEPAPRDPQTHDQGLVPTLRPGGLLCGAQGGARGLRLQRKHGPPRWLLWGEAGSAILGPALVFRQDAPSRLQPRAWGLH